MKNRKKIISHAACLFVLAVLGANFSSTNASELNLVATLAMKPAVAELIPQFEQATGNQVNMEFLSSALLNRQIESGRIFDIAISNTTTIEGLIRQKKIAASTRKNIARSGMAVAVRSGSLRPDVNSSESFKKTLLNARSIGYADPSAGGFSGFYISELFSRLGIASDVKEKVRLKTNGHDLAESVKGGKVDIALMQTTEIAVERGLQQVGLFPPGLQKFTVFTAGISTKSEDEEGAKSLIDFLVSPPAALTFKNKGLTQVPSQM